MAASPTPAWWTLSEREVFDALGTTERGLPAAEAAYRLRRDGENRLSAERGRSALSILVGQFTSPLILILIVASLISGALGERTSTAIILLVTIGGGLLAFSQEYRSERVLQKLARKLSRWATVVRDGKELHADATQIVRGDIVELEAGNVAPADIRLIAVDDLEIDESALTGESLPVPKSTTVVAHEHAQPQERVNIVFSGSPVVQGRGRGVVVATGALTEVGRLSASLSVRQPETEFQKGVRAFGSFLLKVTLTLTGIVFVVLLLRHGEWTDTLLFSLALAVGISPELLPLIVTITLSNGALAMSRKHVLVKRLIAIEDLGNADVMCTDKTGTLTVGALRIRECVDPMGQATLLPLSHAMQCVMNERQVHTNPIDHAIRQEAERRRLAPAIPHGKTLDVISFDFTRRRMSCVLENRDGCSLVTKGASAEVVALCTSFLSANGQSAPMDAASRHAILELANRYHDEGARLIAVARRSIEHKKRYAASDEQGLELVGFIIASDAPKATAKASIRNIHDLGVRIVLLTGDNERVTKSVAEHLAFPIEDIKLGSELDGMDDAELDRVVTKTNVFARITPEHKLRIIEALQRNGRTVGFMGDGINDAPALRAADVGISFHEATDVAREAADVILLRRGLDVVSDGILEGRRTFSRTMTYIRPTISSNFGNMISVATAAIFLPFIPLLPAQILLLNLVSDLPMLAIPSDTVRDDELRKPQHWDVRGIGRFMYLFGPISSIADFATFALLLTLAGGSLALFRTGWFLESLLTEILVIFVFRTRLPFWKGARPSKPLIIASIAVAILGFVIVRGPLGSAFDFVHLPLRIIFPILGIVTAYVLATEVGKRILLRRNSLHT
jgi:Mg2+-importing ATPase